MKRPTGWKANPQAMALKRLTTEEQLAEARSHQQRCGDYIRTARNYPEWLLDTEGALRGAADNLMEEAIILAEQRRLQ